ncbi:MAG: prepilin-type N-terminal cleavage/methylation domain-containing protein [Planctomycetaceae bacterium]|nr:prepilin-type N-terminal cleavage/methylation domain-containing protein [Planctomycetaceae bacterium]
MKTSHPQFEISNWRSPRTSRPGERATGFTLIELLTAIALLAVVLPAVVSAINLALSAGGFAREQAVATALAQDKMAQLLAETQWQQPTMAGDFSPDRPDIRWQGQLQDWNGTLRQLDVTVTWVSSSRQHSLTLSTLVKTEEAQ